MNRVIVLSAALAIGLGGCVTPPSSPVATTVTAPASASDFVTMAGSSNLLEVESSRLAMRRSRDAEVRRFAQRMIRDHSMAGRRMMAALRRAGLPASAPVMSSRHRAMLDQLEATSPNEFDAAYITLQTQAHDEAVALFSAYSQRGDNPALTAFASETLPTLEMHAEHVRRLGAGGA